MALDVSAVTGYVKDNFEPLLIKSLFTPRTTQIVIAEGTLMTGIKTTDKISILATDAIFQSGVGCTRTPSGTTTLTNRTITVAPITVVEEICVRDLRPTAAARKLTAGSRENSLPFEQEYNELKAGTIAEQLEIAIWQGDTTSGDANLKRFDGYIKIIDAAGSAAGVVQANAAAFIGTPIAASTGITTGNVMSIVNATWLALPVRVQGKTDVRIFCGWDTFNKYVLALTNANLFNYAATGKEVASGEIAIPGTNYTLTAVHGLDGTNRLFGSRMRNFVVGTDMENEEERYTMQADQFDNFLHWQVDFKYGVQIAFPNEFVTFTLT